MSRFDALERMRDEEIRKRDTSDDHQREMETPRQRPQTPAAEALATEIEPIMQAIATLSATTAQDIAKAVTECREMRNSTIQMLAKMGEGMKVARESAIASAKDARQNQQEAQTAGVLVLEASKLMQEHTLKARMLLNVWRWAYPLITAVFVSLLWAALLLWRLPDYEDITRNQGQIWQKLETMSAAQEGSKKEAPPSTKR